MLATVTVWDAAAADAADTAMLSCCGWCRHEKLRCRYSDIADGEPGNHCLQAHSQDELDEWKNRYQWRQMKKQMAKDRHLYSYMDTLVDEIAAAAAGRTAPVVCLLCLSVASRVIVYIPHPMKKQRKTLHSLTTVVWDLISFFSALSQRGSKHVRGVCKWALYKSTLPLPFKSEYHLSLIHI